MDDPGPKRYGRGLFLATLFGGLTSIAWGRPVWNRVSAGLTGVEALVPLVPHGWRIYSVAPTMPTFDPATWRLSIDGLVHEKLSLSYEELRALPRAHQVTDFHCVTGWTVRNVHWTGVRFSHLLDQVGVLPEAKAIRFQSLELPYNDSLTLDQVRLKDVMLAIEMNGKPITRAHGAPVRVVIPEMYGY